jgi:cytoskeletal protein RodZ
MPTVAEQLHQAREARKMSIQQVADVIKIRTDHVRALEEGNFDVFTAPVFIRGFVRTYATLLKLDVPKTMAELDVELGRTQKFAEPPALTDRPRGALDFIMLWLASMDWRKGLLLVGMFVLLAVISVCLLVNRHYQNSDPLRGLKPALYQADPATSGETLPVPAPHH